MNKKEISFGLITRLTGQLIPAGKTFESQMMRDVYREAGFNIDFGKRAS